MVFMKNKFEKMQKCYPIRKLLSIGNKSKR